MLSLKRSLSRITRKLQPPTRQQRHRAIRMEALESRQMMAMTTFQEGAGGYTGTQDTVLYSLEPDVNLGTTGVLGPDQQDQNGVRQGLLRFDNIIGPTAIPKGARINSATLIVDVKDSSNSAMQMSLYRMLADWSESTATWNSFGAIGGVQASEGESSDLPPDAVLLDPNVSPNSPTAGRFGVTRSLEYWAAGEGNFGWLVESASTNGWDMRTKEAPLAQRPQLVVDWVVPATNEFQILNTRFSQAEGNSGTTVATVEVARAGNLSSPASITYSVTAGTAQAGDFVAVPNGTLDFAAGEALATIDVVLNGDTDLEALETVLVQLTSGNRIPGRDAATVTIGDDDALINEVLANVTNAVNETNREFIELLGNPNASLDGYYFVVFEGEEEGDANNTLNGASAGVADFVFNLSGHSFGSNGLLVIAPSTWDYQSIAAPGTAIINTSALDGSGGILEDNSQTYALIRSPSAPIVQGTDYDTVGTYETTTAVAIGLGVGVLDQLPAGAEIVDIVGIVEGGGNDRDRVATPDFPGNPGVHIHQPTSITPGGNVASDAISRRLGQTLPNSIGAWFNGDIADGNPSTGLSYANDSFFISVVSPDGAKVTPGQPNQLRTVYFRVTDQDKEVAEANGSVTVRIERTGDLNESISISYNTVDFGSASANQDFTPNSETIQFGVGESFRDITITILADAQAEGFEQFRIAITNASNEYKITDGKPNTPIGAVNGEALITIVDANVLTKSFENGVDGYFGTTDGYIDGELITDKFGQDPVVRVDQVKGEGEPGSSVRPQQGLLRFDSLFGNAANQVPLGSTIFSAFLTLNVQNTASGADVRFFRMLQDWEQVNMTWSDPQGNVGSSIVNGVTPDGVEATSIPDARVPDAGRAGEVLIPLNTDTVQAWADGSLPNFGWSIVSDSGSLWAFNSAESFLIGTAKPKLTLLYTNPVAGEFGAFSLSNGSLNVNENSNAIFTVNRIGGSTGAASVQWSVSSVGDNTGSLADIQGPSSGTISFADGELFDTFSIPLNNDAILERNETLTVTLSGTGLNFGRTQATLTIRDNDFNPLGSDLLLNEMFINSPGNDPPHEFVELKGLSGIGMGSLYYVAIEGLVGDREGSAEKVVDLGDFLNGSDAGDGRGYSVLTPTAANFAYKIRSGTTQIDRLGPTSQENVASDNGSTTYMLLYSPVARLTETEFDYDWDNDGSLELPAGVQIVDSLGLRILGAQDQLYGPSSNQLSSPVDPEIDAISRIRTNTQRSRGDAWFGGNLLSAGDDYLLYQSNISFGLPVIGSAASPGDPNTGNASQSPLVSLQTVTQNPDGSVTATFSGMVSQVNAGDGSAAMATGAGVTITDANGVVVPSIDARPMITGIGTNTLRMTFSGGGVVNGRLPAGTYRLNFVGNGIIANSRATDVANNNTQINGFRGELLTVAPSVDGDFDNDGDYDCADVNALTTAVATSGSVSTFDLNGDSLLSILDVDAWRAEAGAANLGAGRVYLQGDANLDGGVDGSDFGIWNASKFTTVAQWCSGDFNADGAVDGSDFGIWNANKFTSSDTARSSTLPAVNLTASKHELAERITAGTKAPVTFEDQVVAERTENARTESGFGVVDQYFAELSRETQRGRNRTKLPSTPRAADFDFLASLR
jgi:Calx-beta domain